MKKFEYITIQCRSAPGIFYHGTNSGYQNLKSLERLGLEGWELISTGNCGEEFVLFFKRGITS